MRSRQNQTAKDQSGARCFCGSTGWEWAVLMLMAPLPWRALEPQGCERWAVASSQTGRAGWEHRRARTVMDGVACSARSIFFPTGSARPQRAASSVNGLVTCSGNWSRGLGKTQGLPGALGSAAGVWECSRGLGVQGSGWGCDRGWRRKSSSEGGRSHLTL